jgi:hypothetical protein
VPDAPSGHGALFLALPVVLSGLVYLPILGNYFGHVYQVRNTVLRAWVGSDRLACLGATLRGVCPLAEGTLGWYSVYDQVLATTFVPALLWDLRRATTVTWGRAGAWLAILVVAMDCFGTAVGVALVFPLLLVFAAGPTIPLQEFPAWAGLFESFFSENPLNGRPVRFVTDDRAVLRVREQGGRIATLLFPLDPAAP